jgi:hypothetical protein
MTVNSPGRNEPCPCGSGKKFKKCHGKGFANATPPEVAQTSEMLEIARKYKDQHMSQWPDLQIPALGGLTPREAAERPGSRSELELLLREMEMHEARLPEEERFDMDRLRETLGMAED